METNEFNWEEIKEKLQKSIKLEEYKEDLSIKITILEENIEENKMIGGLLKGEEEMKQSLSQFLGRNEPIDCDIDISHEEKSMLLKFYSIIPFYLTT